MRPFSTPVRYEPFFLSASPGKRLCIYHPPADMHPRRGSILHVHAFAEEMNKSRRMVALQARAFANLGFGVLLVDLYGCGDSDGDFLDARWDIWKEDISHAVSWLRMQGEPKIMLWGLRLGALLMMDYAHEAQEGIDGFVLWHPVISGEAYLTQFLRLRLANEMLAGSNTKLTTKDLRYMLRAGEYLEIAGYQLAPDMAMALNACKLTNFEIAGSTCHWIDVVAGEGGAPSPANQRVIDNWNKAGVYADIRTVKGEPFWSTQEITECPALIVESSRLFTGRQD